MIKIFLPAIISFFIFNTNVHAQTLTAANCNPAIGDVFSYSSSEYAAPGSPGAANTWNFSTLTNNSAFSVPYNIQASSAVALPNTFASANIACMRTSYQNDFFAANINSLDYYGNIVGNGAPYDITEYSNPETVLKYPFSINSINTDSWGLSDGSLTGITSITADATGTLITPFATYPNTLRVHSVQSYTNTGVSTHTVDTYSWYTPGLHGALLSIISQTTNNQNGATQSQESKIYNGQQPTGINTVAETGTKIQLFPNPAADLLIIEHVPQGCTSVSIYNINSQLVVEEKNMAQIPVRLNVSQVEPGIYFVIFSNTANSALARKKIIIAR